MSYSQRPMRANRWNLLEVADADVHAFVDGNVALRDRHDCEQRVCRIVRLPQLVTKAFRVPIDIGFIMRIEVSREIHLRRREEKKNVSRVELRQSRRIVYPRIITLIVADSHQFLAFVIELQQGRGIDVIDFDGLGHVGEKSFRCGRRDGCRIFII